MIRLDRASSVDRPKRSSSAVSRSGNSNRVLPLCPSCNWEDVRLRLAWFIFCPDRSRRSFIFRHVIRMICPITGECSRHHPCRVCHSLGDLAWPEEPWHGCRKQFLYIIAGREGIRDVRDDCCAYCNQRCRDLPTGPRYSYRMPSSRAPLLPRASLDLAEGLGAQRHCPHIRLMNSRHQASGYQALPSYAGQLMAGRCKGTGYQY